MRGAATAIDFDKAAFGATEVLRMADPSGKVMHAEVRIGDSVVMLADEHPEFGAVGPQSIGGTSVGLAVYVPDVDAVFGQAVAAGGAVERPLKDQFHGDRTGTLIDPFGHKWTVATHVEDVSPEEMDRRAAEMMKKAG